MATRVTRSHLSHWGAYDAVVEDERLVSIQPFEHDPDPSPVLGNIASSARHANANRPADDPGWLARSWARSDGSAWGRAVCARVVGAIDRATRE